MTKRQLIDEIITRNRSAQPSFLARFDTEDLQDYLDHLCVTTQPRLRGDPSRYDKYFQVSPAPTVPPVAPHSSAMTIRQDAEAPAAEVFFRTERDDADLAASASSEYDELTDLAEPVALEEPPAGSEAEVHAEDPDDGAEIRTQPVIRWREPEDPRPVRVAEPSARTIEGDTTPASPRASRLAAGSQPQAPPSPGGQDEDAESWLF